jgi:hypothetical protein
MIEIKESDIGLIISGTIEEMEKWKEENGPIFFSDKDSIDLKINRIRSKLEEAGIKHIDLVYDYVEGGPQVRIYKRAMAMGFDLNENPMFIAHKLGWHKFE